MSPRTKYSIKRFCLVKKRRGASWAGPAESLQGGHIERPHGREGSDKGVLASEKVLDCLVRTVMIRYLDCCTMKHLMVGWVRQDAFHPSPSHSLSLERIRL